MSRKREREEFRIQMAKLNKDTSKKKKRSMSAVEQGIADGLKNIEYQKRKAKELENKPMFLASSPEYYGLT